MKNLIFISHANPEENYFATWLSVKLRVFGYNTWVDTQDIPYGRAFWPQIQEMITEKACRFISIASVAYLKKYKRSDSGIFNEIELARTRLRDDPDFIIPVRYEDCDFNQFGPGLIGKNTIVMNNDFAFCLNELLTEFEKTDIPKKDGSGQNVLEFWKNSRQINYKPLDKSETYSTNWFEVEHRDIFVHTPKLFEEIWLANFPYPCVEYGNSLISFCSSETLDNYLPIKKSRKFKFDEFNTNSPVHVSHNLKIKNPNKKLVELLNKSMHKFLVNSNLEIYEQANNRKIYFFKRSDDNTIRVSLKHIHKNSRTIMGNSKGGYWYYAVGVGSALFPFPHFKLSHHLVFQDDQFRNLNSDDQHSKRRSMTSDWYNRKWLEILLAFVKKLNGNEIEDFVRLPVGNTEVLKMSAYPLQLNALKGYNEPGKQDS